MSNEIQACTENFEQKNNDKFYENERRNGKYTRSDFERNKIQQKYIDGNKPKVWNKRRTKYATFGIQN